MPPVHIYIKHAVLFIQSHRIFVFLFIVIIVFVLLSGQDILAQKKIENITGTNKNIALELQKTKKDYEALKNQDQYKINQQNLATIKNIEDTYSQSASLYEKLLDVKSQTKGDTKDLDSLFAESLSYLSKKNYASASANLQVLSDDIQKQEDQLTAATAANIPANAPQNNTPPGSGFSVQAVSTDLGAFTVKIVAADLNSTRVIVDTASDSDCSNNCPVLSLSDYISRNGAFAGINGTFFCPVDYPSCAGKTGSFDTLLMNKNKKYFNSDNNVYSTVPLVYFTGSQMGVRGHSSDWGRDTSVDSVIAMQPLLISSGSIVYDGGSSDGKYLNKGTRDFVAAKGSTVYIGVIYGADMRDAAHVLKALAMDNALNLDEGGSTALWANGGYQAGPGRNIPNALLFVHK